MQCFVKCFSKILPPDVLDDVFQKAKHRTNDASNDVNRPPLGRHRGGQGQDGGEDQRG